MNSKVESQAPRMDTVKLGMAALLLMTAVVAFYYFEGYSLLIRVIGLLGTAVVSIGIASQTDVGRRVLGILQDARNEVRKVVWPSRQETMQTTLMVIIMVIIMGIILWLFDMFLAWAIRIVTGVGG